MLSADDRTATTSSSIDRDHVLEILRSFGFEDVSEEDLQAVMTQATQRLADAAAGGGELPLHGTSAHHQHHHHHHDDIDVVNDDEAERGAHHHHQHQVQHEQGRASHHHHDHHHHPQQDHTGDEPFYQRRPASAAVPATRPAAVFASTGAANNKRQDYAHQQRFTGPPLEEDRPARPQSARLGYRAVGGAPPQREATLPKRTGEQSASALPRRAAAAAAEGPSRAETPRPASRRVPPAAAQSTGAAAAAVNASHASLTSLHSQYGQALRSGVLYASMGAKTYLAHCRQPHKTGGVRKRSDPVAKGQAMREAWSRDGFLTKRDEGAMRWQVRQSLLRWDL